MEDDTNEVIGEAIKEAIIDEIAIMSDEPARENSKALRTIITTLANTKGGAKGRVTAIKKILADEDAHTGSLLSNVFKYAYDDGIRFGISMDQIEVPVTLPSQPKDFDHWVFQVLDEVRVTPGRDAKRELIETALAKLTQPGREVMTRIIGKDLCCGVNESSVNKAIPGLLSVFDVMLARPFKGAQVKSWPVAVEPKLDGLRCIAEVNLTDRSIRFLTRSGKDITSLGNFEEEAINFAWQFGERGFVVFDGEVTSGTFADSMSSLRSKSEQATEATFHVFDVLVSPSVMETPLSMSNEELEKQGTQRERRARLDAAFKTFKVHVPEPKFIQPTWTYLASSEDEVQAVYARCRDMGLEGVIVKNLDAPYVKKRSPDWMKIKAEETADLPIVGAFEGEGQFVGMLGGIIVVNEGVEVRVGSGFSAEQRKEFWDQFVLDMKLIEEDRRGECKLIDSIAEVQYQEVLPSKSLRHPVFVRMRHDKSVAVGAF